MFFWFFQIGNGLLRVMKGDFYGILDIILVDIVFNMMIVVVWDNVVYK